MEHKPDLSNSALLRKLDIQGLGAIVLTIFVSGGAWYVLADDVEENRRQLQEIKKITEERYKTMDQVLRSIDISIDAISTNQAAFREQINNVRSSQLRIEENQEYIRKKVEGM